MPETLQSYMLQCEGGLNLTADVASLQPGEARLLQNFEPGLFGGYRRLDGFDQYLAGVEVSGSGPITGVYVFESGVVAARDDSVWYASVSALEWTKITDPGIVIDTDDDILLDESGGALLLENDNQILLEIASGSTNLRLSAARYRFIDFYEGGSHKIVMVDGVNSAGMWDTVTYTPLSGGGAPADPSLVEFYQSHLFLAGYSANEAALTFSQPGSAAGFDAGLGAGEINVGDRITGLKALDDQLVIFCARSIHRLLGNNFANFQLQPVTTDLGCLYPDSIIEIGGDLMFMGPDGINTLSTITQLGNVQFETITLKIQKELTNLIKDNSTIVAAAVREKNQYRIFANNTVTPVENGQGFLGGLRRSQQTGQAGWEWATIKGIKPYCTHSDYISNDEFVIHGAEDGRVYRQEFGDDFAGEAVDAIYHTPFLFMDQPDIRKIIQRSTTYLRLEGSTAINIQLQFDYGDGTSVVQPKALTISPSGGVTYGTAVYGVDTYSLIILPAIRKNMIGSGFNVSVLYSTNDIRAPYSIQAIGLEYAWGGRR